LTEAIASSHYGGKRKGKRGRGTAGKTPAFGILKRKNKVFTKMIPYAQAKTLMPIIREKIKPDSIIYTDSLSSYNILAGSEFKHECINHDVAFVSETKNHINGIENFWNAIKASSVSL